MSDTISQTIQHPICFCDRAPVCLIWQLSESVRVQQGLRKTGRNFKINSEYLLGATFVFDTLSCVPSQFAGTAWVCHSFLSQHSWRVSSHRSHCLSFGVTNKWSWQLSFSLPTDSSWLGGVCEEGASPPPSPTMMPCREFRPFTVSPPENVQGTKRRAAVNTWISGMCAGGVPSEVLWLLQGLNKPAALRALAVRSSLLPIKDGPCY